GSQVSHDESHFKALVQQTHRLAQESGFARARRGNHVQHEKSTRAEKAAVAFGQAIVFFENGPVQFEGSPRLRGLVRMCLAFMSVSVRVSMCVRVLFSVVMAGSMLVVMAVPANRERLVMRVGVFMAVMVFMSMVVRMFMFVVMSTNSSGVLAG